MRTLSDLLRQATTATTREARETNLDAAFALARSCHDFRTLLAGVALFEPVQTARLVALAERTLELGHEEGAVWAFRDVATVRAVCLDDLDGARDALEACEAMFHAPRLDIHAHIAAMLGEGRPSTKGYQWVLLAEGFVATLDDHEGMRRCLLSGRDMARESTNADDLCAIAVAWAEHVDHEAGAGLLREAEAMADNGTASPWTLANAWSSLADDVNRTRVLDAALARATACADAVHVARAFASHQRGDHVRDALDRAGMLATTTAAWLEIAEVAFDASLDEAALRHAIARAGDRAITDEDKANVARAYAEWLGDEVASAQFGPRGVRPEALRTRVRTLEGWEGSASALFDELRARATTETLSRIAGVDPFSADKHLAALRDICETGLLPRRFAWAPHEALALTRWAEGEHVDHHARALVTTLLCLVPGDMEALVVNGVILAESALALGPETARLAEALFVWWAQTEAVIEAGEDDLDPEHPVALLLVFLLRTAEAADDERLDALSRQLTEHPTYTLGAVAEAIADSMRPASWDALFETVLVPAASRPAVARVLRALGR